ncbi:hypothetical protein BH11CYA1_BH11CYA1_07190 [soil metagenome]
MTTNNTRTTLVVVDAQPIEFKAARHPSFQQSLVGLVQSAIALGWDILVLEYSGAGKTLSEVTALLCGYARSQTIEKQTDGGGEEVWLALAENGFGYGQVFISGCNTHGCIQDTTSELSVLLPESEIAVVKPACNDDRGNTWSRFKCATNVQLVDSLPAAA